MPELILHPEHIEDPQVLVDLCPFGAMELDSQGNLSISPACKMCRLCVRKGPKGAVEFREDAVKKPRWTNRRGRESPCMSTMWTATFTR
nr:hypothetical protein [Faecalibaculum rodentium]